MKFISMLIAPMALLAATVTAAPPSQSSSSFITASQSTHNSYRSQHSAANLVWNSTLANYARTWANKCKMEHSHGPYGENIYAFSTSNASPDFIAFTKTGIKKWMAEQPLYKGGNNYDGALHYTQVVWKASRQIGCAWTASKCSNGYYYYFCEYFPKGNYVNQFTQNVSPQP